MHGCMHAGQWGAHAFKKHSLISAGITSDVIPSLPGLSAHAHPAIRRRSSVTSIYILATSYWSVKELHASWCHRSENAPQIPTAHQPSAAPAIACSSAASKAAEGQSGGL